MSKKKEIRIKFKVDTFARENNKCRCCGELAVDAHHITDRNEMPNGGYVMENGISLCEACHIKAEKYHQTDGTEWEDGFHPNDLYELINSSYDLAYEKSLLLKNL